MGEGNEGKRLFQSDNPFNSFLTLVFDMMELSILWLVFCLPIITIGASTTALYYEAMKLVRDEGSSVSKGFLKSFKENFKESVPFTLIELLIVAVLVFDFHYLRAKETAGASISYGILLFAAILAVAVFSYAYPLLAHDQRGTVSVVPACALFICPGVLDLDFRRRGSIGVCVLDLPRENLRPDCRAGK